MFCGGKYQGVLGEGDEKYWMGTYQYEQGLGVGILMEKFCTLLKGECLLEGCLWRDMLGWGDIPESLAVVKESWARRKTV